MELQQAASPLRLVLADSTAATLATCACVSRDLWQTAKSVAIARLTILLADVDMGGLPNDDLLGANILFLLATVENDSARGTRSHLMPMAAAMQLVQHALGGHQPVWSNPTGCILHISVGANHVVCTTSAGRVFSCGSGRHGRLGYRLVEEAQHWQRQFREVDFPIPCKGQRTFVVKAEAGGRHSVALDSQGRAYTWGFGRRGRLGHGDGRTYYAPHCVVFGREAKGQVARFHGKQHNTSMGEAHTGHLALVDVSAGGAHTLFVAASGDAFSCGVGGDGRLGLGHSTRMFHPAHVLSLALAGVRVVACAAGGGLNEGRKQCEFGAHSVFLAADGSCWSCGCVGNGRLGMRTRIFSRKGYGAFSRTCYSWSSPHSSINQMIPAQMTAWDPSARATVPSCDAPPRVNQVVAGERSTLLLCEDNSLISFGMSLRGSKAACSLATDKFLEAFGSGRLEGMDDLHGVPPDCLVSYGGQPEDPFIERPQLTAPVGARSARTDCVNGAKEGTDCKRGEDEVVNTASVFGARGWLFARGQSRDDGDGICLWRKREDAGSPTWELLQ